MAPTFTDIFCGAGGSSTGLVNAGFELKLAANHWERAIQTHAANHPGAEHLCADLDHYDMRRLPKTDVLWASPICTEISPSGGRKRTRKGRALPGQEGIQELGYVPQAGFERTRATAYDILRAAEVNRYSIVMYENVPEFATGSCTAGGSTASRSWATGTWPRP
jgi:DNA (cytosine-5)-methyltransferase 1